MLSSLHLIHLKFYLPRWMLARGILGHGQTLGVSFQPFPNSSVKVAGIVPWIHHTRVKRTYHADPRNTEWAAQRDPTDPRETKTILKKKEKKILEEPLQDAATQPPPAAWPHQCDFEFNFRFNSGQCFHLMGTLPRRLPHSQLLGV